MENWLDARKIEKKPSVFDLRKVIGRFDVEYNWIQTKNIQRNVITSERRKLLWASEVNEVLCSRPTKLQKILFYSALKNAALRHNQQRKKFIACERCEWSSYQ